MAGVRKDYALVIHCANRNCALMRIRVQRGNCANDNYTNVLYPLHISILLQSASPISSRFCNY